MRISELIEAVFTTIAERYECERWQDLKNNEEGYSLAIHTLVKYADYIILSELLMLPISKLMMYDDYGSMAIMAKPALDSILKSIQRKYQPLEKMEKFLKLDAA